MKTSLTRIFALIGLFALASNCALLDSREDGPDIGDEEDPVARVALQLRDEKLGSQLSDDDLDRIERARLEGDLTTGMNAGDVLGAWGSPLQVEPTPGGTPGSERWLYRDGLTRFNGLQQTRIVYFENHRVVGWETAR